MAWYRSRGEMINRAVAAVRFIEDHKGRTFSREDLGEAIGVSQRYASVWLDALSLHYPISTVREVRYCGRGIGTMPELLRHERV